jgi:hypothetical protein
VCALYDSKSIASDGGGTIAGEETGMSSPPDRVQLSERATGILAGQGLVPIFSATLFLSAALLFAVQPMLTKMVLPQLGGTPSVWNTCLCFFQATLLLGYLYAHLLATWLKARTQLVVHTLVLASAVMFLPLDASTGVQPPGGAPALWLILRLAPTVGIPFFAITATAPLLQRWFSRTDHETAADPYFLYAASNAGSLLALLCYPMLIEPHLRLSDQSRLWSAGLGILVAAIALCWLAYRNRENPARQPALASHGARIGGRLRWIAYSFVPSSLLLAVTAHVTTDLASAPLFWVVPLALYLLTFAFVFARRPPLPHQLMVRLQPLVVIPMILLSFAPPNIWLLFLQLAGFFVIAMVCHGELAARRPPVRDLTGFYLCISLGGVLGGLFNAIIAPVIFSDVWEYPIMIVASCLIRPVAGAGGGPSVAPRYFILPALVFLVLLTLLYASNVPAIAVIGALVLTAVVLLNLSERRWPFALGIAACLLVVQLANPRGTLETTRSFFGVYRVRLVEDGALRVLQHGTTIHGVASTRPGDERVPLGYYSQNGPFGRFFKATAGRPLKRVGVIGLGAGELGCYARPGQVWVFHEIDPAVEQLARDERFFNFLTRCGEKPRLVFGDARLTLQDMPDFFYDALVIDAFSSDSIPVHLLTREALALYHRKLATRGVILFHISNRYLDLAPVITALAADAGASARHLHYRPAQPNKVEDAETVVVAVSQRGGDLGFLDANLGWELPAPVPSSAMWTDERSDIVSRIKWR